METVAARSRRNVSARTGPPRPLAPASPTMDAVASMRGPRRQKVERAWAPVGTGDVFSVYGGALEEPRPLTGVRDIHLPTGSVRFVHTALDQDWLMKAAAGSGTQGGGRSI